MKHSLKSLKKVLVGFKKNYIKSYRLKPSQSIPTSVKKSIFLTMLFIKVFFCKVTLK